MKNLLLLLLFCVNLSGWKTVADPSVYLGDKTLATQAEVNDFGASYSGITGSLRIEESSPGAIQNLDALDGLAFIGVDLFIFGNSTLTDVDGFSSLTSVGDELSIRFNSSLTNLDGFSGLVSVGGGLVLEGNNALTNVDGFGRTTGSGGGALSSVGGTVFIQENDALTNVDGFSGLKEVGTTLSLWNNDVLANVDGFSNLRAIGDEFIVGFNKSLKNFAGFAGLSSVGGRIIIRDNTVLDLCCGIADLITEGSVGEGIFIFNNPVGCSSVEDIVRTCSTEPVICEGSYTLTTQEEVDNFGGDCIGITGSLRIEESSPGAIQNLDALDGLTFIGVDLFIFGNSALTDVDGFSSLTSVGDELSIRFNSSLTNLDGFSGLVSVGGGLVLEGNNALTNVDGFGRTTDASGGGGALASVGGTVFIQENDALTNVDGFSGLSEVGTTLSLWNNDVLADVDGFSNLKAIGDEFIIGFNKNLRSLDAFSGLSSIGGRVIIRDNAVLDLCCGIAHLFIEGSVGEGIFVFNNPEGCSDTEDVLTTCLDEDGDGVTDSEDECYNPGLRNDSDGDGVGDPYDQCPCVDDRIDADLNGCPDCSPDSNGGINYDEASLASFYCDDGHRVAVTYFPPQWPRHPRVICVPVADLQNIFSSSPGSYLGDGSSCTGKSRPGRGEEKPGDSGSTGPETGKPTLEVGPNPTRGQLQYRVTTAEEASATVRVYSSMRGRVIYQRHFTLVAGVNSGELDLQQFPGGVYLLEMRFGEHKLYKRFILHK